MTPSLRVLVAGDKSHAGKSTVSLGLLAALLESGFSGSDIAYIKPATQCVSSTLTARFCQANGIAYEHIGPVVFYRGFTRGQLDAVDTDASPLVERCAEAVERISSGKKLTLIDGVGYPAVGSIVSCSSADVAVACRAPVVVVGRPGVGDAIDSFNLCASYFEAQRVPVLGGIFNKLGTSGFYSERCALWEGRAGGVPASARAPVLAPIYVRVYARRGQLKQSPAHAIRALYCAPVHVHAQYACACPRHFVRAKAWQSAKSTCESI